MLGWDEDPPIQQVIDAGVVRYFVEFLQRDHEQFQLQAVCALTEITFGTHENTRSVVDCGAVPFLVKLITSESAEVRDHAVQVLSNIAGDCSAFRDIVFETTDALEIILNRLHDEKFIEIRRTLVWAINVFCNRMNEPAPVTTQMAEFVFPTLARLISNEEEDEDECNEEEDEDECVIAYACHALGHIIGVFSGNSDIFQNTIKTNILPILVTNLSHESLNLTNGFTSVFRGMMAGDNHQIQTVIDNNIVPKLLCSMKGHDPELRKNSTHAITNATSCASDAQMKYLIDQGCIRSYCELLNGEKDEGTVCLALEGLENIMKVNVRENEANERYLLLIEADGLMRLQELRNHSSKKISEKASALLGMNLLRLVSS